MILPTIEKGATPEQVGKTFRGAAVGLEIAGRAALDAAAPESTKLLLGAAGALRRAGENLLARGRSKSDQDILLYDEVRMALAALAAALPTGAAMSGGYARDRLHSYWVVLGRYARSGPAGPGGRDWPPRIRRPRTHRIGAATLVNDVANVGNNGGSRRFLVEEVTCWPGYIGSIWAVGCTTVEAARTCFDRRVLRNLAEENTIGDIFAYDRHTGDVVAWSSELAKGWLRQWLNHAADRAHD